MVSLELILLIVAVVLVATAFLVLPRLVRRVRGDEVVPPSPFETSFSSSMVAHRDWLARAIAAHVDGAPLPALDAPGDDGDAAAPALGRRLVLARTAPSRARSVARLLRRPRIVRDATLTLGVGSFVTGIAGQPWLLAVTAAAVAAVWIWHRASAAAGAMLVELEVGDVGVRVSTASGDTAVRWHDVAWLTRSVTELGLGRRRLGRRFDLAIGRTDGAAPLLWRCESAADGAPPVLAASLLAARAWIHHRLSTPFDGSLSFPTRDGGAIVWRADTVTRVDADGAATAVPLRDAEVYVSRRRKTARLVVRGADGQAFEVPWRDVSAPTAFEEAWRHFLAPWRASTSASSTAS